MERGMRDKPLRSQTFLWKKCSLREIGVNKGVCTGRGHPLARKRSLVRNDISNRFLLFFITFCNRIKENWVSFVWWKTELLVASFDPVLLLAFFTTVKRKFTPCALAQYNAPNVFSDCAECAFRCGSILLNNSRNGFT